MDRSVKNSIVAGLATFTIAAMVLMPTASLFADGVNLKFHANTTCAGSDQSSFVVNTDVCAKGTGLGEHHNHHLAIFSPADSVNPFVVSSSDTGNIELPFKPNVCGTWTGKDINDENSSVIETAAFTVTGCATPTPTPSSTPTPTPTPSDTPTPTPTPTPSDTPTPTPTPSDTPTPTPTPSDTPTPTPSDTPTPTPTPSDTPTPTPTPSNDPTPTPTPSDTPTPTPDLCDGECQTPNPTPTPSNDPTPTPSTGGGGGGSYTGGGTYYTPTPSATPAPSSTPAPTETPEVLGASTQLPATGLSGLDALIISLCAGLFASGIVLAGSSINVRRA